MVSVSDLSSSPCTFYPKIFQKDNSIELLAKRSAGPVLYYILAISRARVAARASISTAEKDCDSL